MTGNKARSRRNLKMDNENDNVMAAPSCTGLSLTTLTDGVQKLFMSKRQNANCIPSQTSKETAKSPRSEKTRSVKFQYPIITKTHLRPMTEDQEIENLFFTREEMEVLEDDRTDTKFADDVEVLAEGQQSWDIPVYQLSTSSNLSIEEDYIPSKKPLPRKVGTVMNSLSPRTKSIQALSILSERSRKPRKKKQTVYNNQELDMNKSKMVKGVQIVLCEKSSTNDMYLM